MRLKTLLLLLLAIVALTGCSTFCKSTGLCRTGPEEVQPRARLLDGDGVNLTLKTGSEGTYTVVLDRQGIPEDIPIELVLLEPPKTLNHDPLLLAQKAGIIVRKTETQFQGNTTQIRVHVSEQAILGTHFIQIGVRKVQSHTTQITVLGLGIQVQP